MVCEGSSCLTRHRCGFCPQGGPQDHSQHVLFKQQEGKTQGRHGPGAALPRKIPGRGHMPLLLLELVCRTTFSWGTGEGGGSRNVPSMSCTQLTIRNPVAAGIVGYKDGLQSPSHSLPLETSLTWTSLVSLPTSCPEDCRHKEEAAAVHRALQVAPQLPEPLLRLLRAGVRRAHQPGTWGTERLGPKARPSPGDRA